MPKLTRKKTVGKQPNRPRIQKRKDSPKPHPPTKKQQKQKSPPTPKGKKPGRPSSHTEPEGQSLTPNPFLLFLKADPPRTFDEIAEELRVLLKADRPPTTERIDARLRTLRAANEGIQPQGSHSEENEESRIRQRVGTILQAWQREGWLTTETWPPISPEVRRIKNILQSLVDSGQISEENLQTPSGLRDQIAKIKEHDKKLAKEMAWCAGSLHGDLYYPPNAVYDFLETFQKEHQLADWVLDYFVHVLMGRFEPNINCAALYQEWLEAQKKVQLIKTEQAALTSLGRRYRDLDRRIEKDPALAQSFKEHWKSEYKFLSQALADRKAWALDLDFFKPYPPFTVRLDNKNISRQEFWSEVVFKLMTVLIEKVGLSVNRSSSFVADLLSLAFPRLDKPAKASFDSDNIKRRYLHTKKRIPPSS